MTDKTKEIRLPVSVKLDGKYHQPGTAITLPAREADAMIARYGSFEGIPPELTDPGNTAAIGVDAASIATLNEHNAINNPEETAKYRAIGEKDGGDDEFEEKTLDEMTKAELVEYAKAEKIDIEEKASKAEVLEAIKKAEAAKVGA